jgi:hypothetical protein
MNQALVGLLIRPMIKVSWRSLGHVVIMRRIGICPYGVFTPLELIVETRYDKGRLNQIRSEQISRSVDASLPLKSYELQKKHRCRVGLRNQSGIEDFDLNCSKIHMPYIGLK